MTEIFSSKKHFLNLGFIRVGLGLIKLGRKKGMFPQNACDFMDRMFRVGAFRAEDLFMQQTELCKNHPLVLQTEKIFRESIKIGKPANPYAILQTLLQQDANKVKGTDPLEKRIKALVESNSQFHNFS